MRNTSLLLFPLSTLLAFGLTGCGDSSHTSTTSAVSVNPSALAGLYAVRSRIASTQDIPLIGKATSVASLYSIAKIDANGNKYIMTENGCRFVYEGGSAPVKVTVADAVIRAAGAITSPLTVWEESGVVRFQKAPVVQVFGAKLANDFDALPSSATDSRLVDVDQDGHPGATADASGSVKVLFVTKNIEAKIYFVQRSSSDYTGTVVSDNRFSGLVKSNIEQSIVGSDNALLKTFGNVVAKQDPDASKSTVEIVRIPSDATCDSVNWTATF